MAKRKPSTLTQPRSVAIRDRIVELRRVPANKLVPNPKNWRTHPPEQVAALRGLLGEIGFAGAELCRELPDGSLMLIDGHARAVAMGDQSVPCLILDVTEAEADKLLATFDPLGAMAESDSKKLDELLNGLKSDDEAVSRMLDELKSAPVLDFSEPPKSVEENAADIQAIKDQRRTANDGTESKNDTEKYMVIVFDSRQAKERVLKELGLPADERYVPAASVTVKARGLVKPAVTTNGRAIKAASPENSGAGG